MEKTKVDQSNVFKGLTKKTSEKRINTKNNEHKTVERNVTIVLKQKINTVLHLNGSGRRNKNEKLRWEDGERKKKNSE